MRLLADVILDPNRVASPPPVEDTTSSIVITALDLLNTYSLLFVVAFVVTLITTPIVRRIAIAAGVVDHPDVKRKMHRAPVAYLGGVSVFLGLAAAVAVSYATADGYSGLYAPVPMAIMVGMTAILLTGLADDVWGWDPRLKIAGQLVAAAGLALNDVGVRVAEGMLAPIMGGPSDVLMTIGSFEFLNGHVFYWVGTALIAIFVLGGCNSANLLDGLDGLLSGVVCIVTLGLLAISLMMATQASLAGSTFGEESLAGARIVMCVALLGAMLGFLPHNFNPATIFLGDCGSLLIGFVVASIILMLGEQGHTHLVFAGLIVFALPIMDTTLAIIRRRLAGKPMSSADSNHVHHQLLRALGGVKRAVLAMYAICGSFAIVGVTLAWLVMHTDLRVRVIYAIALVLFSFIGVIAVKEAQQKRDVPDKATEGTPTASPTKRPLVADAGQKTATSAKGPTAAASQKTVNS